MEQKETKPRLFYCYSLRLKKALDANGFKYIEQNVHKKTNAVYWVYEGTDEFNYYKDFIYQQERDNF